MIELKNFNEKVLDNIYQYDIVYIYNNNTSTFVTTEKDTNKGVLIAVYKDHKWYSYDSLGKTTKTTISKVKKLIGFRYIYIMVDQ